MGHFIAKLVLTAGLAGMTCIAHAYLERGKAAYERGEYATALKELSVDANKGLEKAQNYLGLMYENGNGTPVDFSKAMSWYRKAADHGFAPAQTSVGYLLEEGKGLPRDYAQALEWYG